MTPFSKFETFLYFGIWTSGVFMSLFRLHLYGRVFNENVLDKYQNEDFIKGWRILGERLQDFSDYEWNSWTQLTLRLLPFLLINLIIAELLRRRRKFNLLPCWYTAVTLSFITYKFSFSICLWYILLAVLYYICLLFKNALIIWIVTLLILYFFKPESWFAMKEEDEYLMIISSSWMILKCISFCIDKFEEASMWKISIKEHALQILLLLGYSMYLPTLFFGPFTLFSDFKKGIELEFEKWNLRRLFENLFRFSKCGFWYLFTELFLHFIYVNAILLRPHLVQHLCDWELAGLGIAMGHFFHLKYVVFYGIPCAWAAAERFKVPELPCCVSRIHLYSQMWRRFDNGLYQFLFNYIYFPVTSHLKGSGFIRKTIASIACFAFVFAWHRGETHVFYWVLFNFLAITIEALGKKLFHLPTVNKIMFGNISEGNIIRIQCLFTAPLHYFSMVSNFFFIGNGMSIGLIYLNKFLNSSAKSTLIVLFFLYGAGQSAVAIDRWEKTRRKLKIF